MNQITQQIASLGASEVPKAMETMELFSLWSTVSALVCIASLIWSFLIKPRLHRLPQAMSSLNHFTFGVFLAGVLLFVPVNALEVPWVNTDPRTLCGSILHTFFWSLVNSLRLFVLGIDPNVILGALPTAPALTAMGISSYAACLYFLAPALTFTTVLSFFGNFMGVIRLRLCRLRKIFIMSELNVQAVAMASEIAEHNRRKLLRPLLVFADVPATRDDVDYELLQQVRKLNGLCLKADAAHLHLAKYGRAVEIFLLGVNETENVAQAIALTKQLQNGPREIFVYVYAPMDYADNILDSLFVDQHSRKDKSAPLLSREFTKWAADHSEGLLTGSEWAKLCIPIRGNFSVRRIDPVNMLVRSVLTNDHYRDYQRIFQAAEEDKVISITILGMGRYGSHFLKTAVWFYQRYGYRVEINVIDVGIENGDIEKRFTQECPELISKGNAPEDGEAKYDIQFFQGIDCLGSELTKQIEGSERFAKTKLAFIALGEDDLNIQVAMRLRTLFDRISGRNGKTPSASWPLIYALIYDDQKVSNLSASSFGDHFRDHKNNAFDICFVSALTSQYSYQVIDTIKQLEETAFKHHLDWSRKESQLRIYYELAQQNASPFPAVDLELCKEFKEALDASVHPALPQWNDNNFIIYDKNNAATPFSLNAEELRNQAEKYIRYAYNRNSSIAKAEHKHALSHLPAPARDDAEACRSDFKDLCSCKACTQRRITEHMRWNAYMRSIGYVYGPRSSRAKQHTDLVPWSRLPLTEQYKD